MPLVDGRVPDAGDVYWIDLGSPVGREQAGRRPTLVLSPLEYNEQSSLFLVCSISRRDRPWPFKVSIGQVGRITGFALVDQIRSIDPLARFCRFAGRVPEETISQVRTSLSVLFALKS